MTLKLFTADLVSLDPEKYTTADVVGAVTQIGMEERMEGESSWPEIGKIINRVKRFRAKRHEEEERAAQSRRLPQTSVMGSVEELDPETRAEIERLNKKFGMGGRA